METGQKQTMHIEALTGRSWRPRTNKAHIEGINNQERKR